LPYQCSFTSGQCAMRWWTRSSSWGPAQSSSAAAPPSTLAITATGAVIATSLTGLDPVELVGLRLLFMVPAYVLSAVGALTLVDPQPARPGDAAPGGLPVTAAGRPRAAAAADVVRAASPATRTDDASAVPAGCDLVVVTIPDRGLAERLVGSRLPHLFVSVRETTAVVGPFVRPGESSCARCHDLNRADRDPAWPRLVSQLAARTGPEPCEGTLAAVAASLGAAHALRVLEPDSDATRDHAGADGAALSDATVEIGPPDWRLRRRTWQAHPDCDCGAARPHKGIRADTGNAGGP